MFNPTTTLCALVPACRLPVRPYPLSFSPWIAHPDESERLPGGLSIPLPALLRRCSGASQPRPVSNRRLPGPSYPGGQFPDLCPPTPAGETARRPREGDGCNVWGWQRGRSWGIPYSRRVNCWAVTSEMKNAESEQQITRRPGRENRERGRKQQVRVLAEMKNTSNKVQHGS